jgi:hypothetical protein
MDERTESGMRTEHTRIWLMAILVGVGVGLTWPLPLGGALLAVVASFGFVISWEAEFGGAVMTEVVRARKAPSPEGP